MAVVSLSAGMRSNLIALQQTVSFIGQTQKHLSTGLAVADPIDDPVKYFAARSLSDRAATFMVRKDEIAQSISSVSIAAKTSTAVEDLLAQMKSLIDSARGGDATQRSGLAAQLTDLGAQINKLANDASYQGINLVNSAASSLTVHFSDKADSKLVIAGNDFTVRGLFFDTNGTSLNVTTPEGIAAALGFVPPSSSSSNNPGNGSQLSDNDIGNPCGQATNASCEDDSGNNGKAVGHGKNDNNGNHYGWNVSHHANHGNGGTGNGGAGESPAPTSPATDDLTLFNQQADLAIARIDQSLSNLHARTARMTQNLSTLKIRLDFTSDYINSLQDGAGKLTLADVNEESAKLLALQTRQDLGIQALSITAQSERSILSLFR